MLDEKLLKLKSGTDVRGVAVDGTSSPVTLTVEAVESIVKSYILFLSEKLDKNKLTVALGHDSRISSPRIYAAAERSALSCGCRVLRCGMSSTPAMFMILQKKEYGCDGSVMITASHLPFERNGLKFFTRQGGLEADEIDEVLSGALKGAFPEGDGSCADIDFMSEYSADLVAMVRKATGKENPLSGKKIVVDASSGVGGFYCENVLIPLGADTEGSVNLVPDGTFPSHVPNPEDKKAIDTLSEAVKANNADFGIIFDTDVDRAACVDSDGTEINRNKLIALISAILLRDGPGTIVTDSVASDHLTEFIKSLGGKHVRYKRGYKNVIDKCISLNESGTYSPLAMETSGHAALKENYFLDDGAYLVTKLLISLSSGENASSLIKNLKLPVEETEIRLSFNGRSRDFREEGAVVTEGLRISAGDVPGVTPSEDDYEGIRLRFDESVGSGWVQIRMSVHDPVIPINLESDETGGVRRMAETLMRLIKGYDFIDLSPLASLAKG